MVTENERGSRLREVIRHVPNVLSGLRLVSVPVLLALAWYHLPLAFLVLLLVSILTDALDGWIARRFDAVTQFGIRLDSVADFALYIAVPLGGWWLWPELLLREAPWIALIVLAYALPGALALFRFHRLASYHTWSAKIAGAPEANGPVSAIGSRKPSPGASAMISTRTSPMMAIFFIRPPLQ
jgi:CDP-diacylglycerol--glycerol-3-phosphate 3-phosphatidyltransferase